MTSREFTESLAFERLEPDPATVTNRLLGQLLALMANVHRDPARKPQPYTLEDFLPNPYGPTRQEREAAFVAVLASFAEHSKRRRGQRH